MTSSAKCAANRANASASTGPKTAAGKVRSAQNARKRGLSLPIELDPLWSEEAEAFANELVSDCTDPEIRQLARELALAQAEFCRICSVRQCLFSEAADHLEWDILPTQQTQHLDRCADTDVRGSPSERPPPEASTTHTFRDKLDGLLILDRYEKRALSRRKFLVRALDQANAARLRKWVPS